MDAMMKVGVFKVKFCDRFQGLNTKFLAQKLVELNSTYVKTFNCSPPARNDRKTVCLLSFNNLVKKKNSKSRENTNINSPNLSCKLIKGALTRSKQLYGRTTSFSHLFISFFEDVRVQLFLYYSQDFRILYRTTIFKAH